MNNHYMFPWIALDIKTPEELEEFIIKNNTIKIKTDDSGFDKTISILEAHHNTAEMVRVMYAYLIDTQQINNYLNYIQGKLILRYE